MQNTLALNVAPRHVAEPAWQRPGKANYLHLVQHVIVDEQPVAAVVCTSWHSVSLAARCTLFPENPLAWRDPTLQSALVSAQNLSFTLGTSGNVWTMFWHLEYTPIMFMFNVHFS